MRRAPGASRVKKYPGNFGCNMPNDNVKIPSITRTVYSADEFWRLVREGKIKTSFNKRTNAGYNRNSIYSI